MQRGAEGCKLFSLFAGIEHFQIPVVPNKKPVLRQGRFPAPVRQFVPGNGDTPFALCGCGTFVTPYFNGFNLITQESQLLRALAHEFVARDKLALFRGQVIVNAAPIPLQTQLPISFAPSLERFFSRRGKAIAAYTKNQETGAQQQAYPIPQVAS